MREKRALVKTASKNYRKNPTNTNALKLKTAQYQLAGIYIKEQTEYIQNQIDKIRDSVEDRQSRIAWQTINEVSRRKNTAKAKLKAANQQERIKLWKQHFENLLGNPPKITPEPITRIISKQLDIKLGPFTQEELDSVLRKIKNRKAAGLDEIPPEVWKTRQFDDILLRHCNAVYNQNPIDRWTKRCILPFPKKGDLGLAKNYRGITLTSIAAKIYNALLRNRIEPKIDNILRKKQNGFRRNRSTTSQILTIRRILEGVRAKNLQATLIFVDFTKAFDSIHRGKMEQILLAYGNYTRMLRAILNKSWQQHPTRHQLYGHLPPITKTIQVRRTRHAGHCWRSRDELIRDVLLWIPTHGRAKAGRPARTYIQQLCEDTGCCPEDLPRAMNDREEWRERVRDIRAASTIWWWWWYIYPFKFVQKND